MRAVVLFCSAKGRWARRLLAPGFQHCEVVVRGQDGWIAIVGGRGPVPWVFPLEPDFEPLRYATEHKVTAITTTIAAPVDRFCWWARVDCVGVVKSVLGLRAPWIVTPWQLWRHLNAR